MPTFHRIRRLKHIAYKYGIHRALPQRRLGFLHYAGAMSRWISEHRDIGYTDFPNPGFDSARRYGLYEYVIEHAGLDGPIDYLEFGVSTGESFRWWVGRIGHADARFHGFDTFTGLPEAWGPFPVGAMANGNAPPAIDDARVRFHQGLFQQTLYPFLAGYDDSRRKVIHLDADLHSATLFVLTTLSRHLKPGDILLFDEFNVPMHEFKAFSEWVAAYYVEYEVLGEVNNYYQVAMRLK